MPHAAVV